MSVHSAAAGLRAARLRTVIAWLCILLLYAGLRINLIDVPLERDEGVFGYVGQLICNGGLPYRDVFDHKPPIVFYLYALALQVFPATAAGMHTFLHLYNVLTLMVLYRLMCLYAGQTAGLATAFLYALYSADPTVQGCSATTELFMLLPLALCLYCGLRYVRLPGPIKAVLSGAFGGLVFWTKPTGLGPVLFVTAFVFWQLPAKKRFGWLVLSLAGLASVLIAVTAAYARAGCLGSFVYWVFEHNVYYSRGLFSPARYADTFLRFAGSHAVPLCLGAVGLAAAWRRGVRHLIFGCGFLLASLAATVPGGTYAHYFAQATPAVAVAGGLGMSALMRLPERAAARRTILTVLLALAALPLLLHTDYYFTDSPERSSSLHGPSLFEESQQVADYIAARSSPHDSVFVFGSEPQILFYAQRTSPSAFIYMYPLTQSRFPGYRAFQSRLIADLTANPPLYFVSVTSPLSFLWDRAADQWIVGQCRSLIAQRYRLEAVLLPGEPHGRLMVIDDLNAFSKRFEGQQFPLYVFRVRPARETGPAPIARHQAPAA